MKKQLIKALITIILAVAAVVIGIWVYIAQPSFRSSAPSDHSVDLERMRSTVQALSVDFYPRNHANLENLNASAAYIRKHFSNTKGTVSSQVFQVAGKDYENIVCGFDGPSDKRIVIGAHYDSHSHTPGADDNGSGVAGLIELAYLLDKLKLNVDIDLVAYTLEEPPFFGSSDMGSYKHAAKLHSDDVDVLGMIALEMIGYFSDEPKSQGYPVPVLSLIYPSQGNFIGVIGSMEQRAFTKKIKEGMKGATTLPVYSINAPIVIPGIDFSDHRNYWNFGYQAVMVTNTAFYRNREYHKAGDTWDRLDYTKMGAVILGVFNAIQQL